MRFFATILTIGGLVLECIVILQYCSHPLANVSDVIHSQSGLGIVAMHALASLLFGLGAGTMLSRDGRRAALASSILYVTFALTFPVFGMAGALAMIWMLKSGARRERVQEEFMVGNPMLERWANRAADHDPEVHTEPLCASMRSLDRDGLAGMILGLRDLLPSEHAHGILDRYQQDQNSQVQFYAQSALSGEIERVEGHLAELGRRVKENPESAAPRAALAEMLLDLAYQRGTTSADKEAHARNAIRHLDIALDREPEYAGLHFLKARAALLLHDRDQAMQSLNALHTLKAPHSMVARVEAKIAFENGNWDTLTSMQFSGVPEIDAGLRYWRDDTQNAG